MQTTGEVTIGQMLDRYYEEHNLGKDGGINDKFAKVKVGPFYLPFPNFKERKKALLFHDMHHLVTGYDTNWKGEFSISTWEISSGCTNYYAAWGINLASMTMGVLLFPRLMWKIWKKGKLSTNLYHHHISGEQAKKMTLPELKQLIQEKSPQKAKGAAWSFIWWTFLGLLMLGSLPALTFLIIFLLLP